MTLCFLTKILNGSKMIKKIPFIFHIEINFSNTMQIDSILLQAHNIDYLVNHLMISIIAQLLDLKNNSINQTIILLKDILKLQVKIPP
jgi:hypothetical protein